MRPPQCQFLRRNDLAGLISPVIVGAALNPQQTALMNHWPALCVIPYKSVLHFISFAKYALASFKISFSIRGMRFSFCSRFSSSRSSVPNLAPEDLEFPTPAAYQLISNTRTSGYL